MSTALFKDLNPLATRQPKTDRLILSRLLDAAKDACFETAAARAHSFLIRWTDRETGGKPDKLKETQLQRNFVAEVFGDALGVQPRGRG